MRILLLEDNPADAELIEYELRESLSDFVLKRVETEEDFKKELLEFSPDLILSDYDLPRYDGISSLGEAKKKCPDVPFILVTGAVTEDRAIQVLTSGAKDYVLKNRLHQRLVPAVQRALAEAADHQARKRAKEEIRKAHDSLEKKVEERTAELQAEIERRKQYEEMQQRNNERLEILSYTAGRLLESEKPQAIVEELCRRVMTFLDCQAFFNFMVDENLGYLKPNAYAGIPDEAAKEIMTLNYGVAVCGCAARDGVRIVAEDIQNTPDERTDLVKSFGMKAYACHPLMSQGNVIGTLSFGTRSRTEFSSNDLSMMKAIADQVAMAMNRIKMENALKESEERFRLMGDTIPYGAWMADAEGRNIYISPLFLELVGMTFEQVKEFGWTGKMPPEDVEPTMRRWMECVRTGRDWEGEMLFPSPDGPWYTILSRGKPVRDEQGQIKAWVGINLDITEHKRNEEQLRQQHELLQVTLSSIGDAVISTDATGRITFMNAVAEALTGWPLSEASGRAVKEIFNIVNEHTRQTVENPVTRVLNEGKIVGLANHTILVRRDGTEVPIDDSGAPIRDADGKTLGVVLVFRDITERKQAEAAVQQQAQLLDLSYDAIFTWDLDGAVEYWNEGAERLYGYNRDEAVGRVSHELLGTRHPISVDELRAVLIRDGVWSGELSHLTKAGHKISIESRHQLIHRDGRLIVLETNRDITDRKHAEVELRQERERFHTTLASIGDAVISTDIAGRITFMNPVAEALTGWILAEASGRLVTEVFNIMNEYTREAVESPVTRVIKEGLIVGLANHTILVRRDGTEVPIDDSGAPIKGLDGRTLGVVLVFRDITDRRRDEMALLSTLQRLDALVSSIPSSILFVGEGGIELANQTFCDYFGLQDSPADLIGLTPRDMIEKIKNSYLHPDEQVSRIQEIINRGRPFIGEEIAMQGGRTCLRDYIPISKDGKEISRLWNHTDITEQKKAEAEMARIASFPMLNPNPIIELDLAGVLHFCNPATEKMFPGLCQGEQGHPLLKGLDAFVHFFRGKGLIESIREVNFNDRWYQQAIHFVEATEHIRIYIRDITEQHQAEEELRRTNENFRVLTQNLSSGVALIDEHGRFSIVNAAFLRIFELPEESDIKNVNDRNWADWKVFDENGTLLDVDEHPVRKAAITGKPVLNQLVSVRPPSGSGLKWILISAEPIFSLDGRLEAIICTYSDITEHKQAEDTLRESEVRFRTMANSIPQLAWIARADGFIFWYNQRWFDYTGTTPEQMERYGWQSVHDPKVLPEVTERWKTAIATGEPFDMEFPLLGADKVFRPFLTRILPLKDEQGRVIQWFGTNTDLSERKRAEEELALNEREFRLLAESMPQIVWTTRADGWNTYFNQRWVDYTGLTLEESYGHGWNKPFHPDDQQRAWDAWQNAVLHNAPYLLQCRLRRADGIYRWWLIHGVPVLDENGNIIKWYGTCTDIDDLKHCRGGPE